MVPDEMGSSFFKTLGSFLKKESVHIFFSPIDMAKSNYIPTKRKLEMDNYDFCVACILLTTYSMKFLGKNQVDNFKNASRQPLTEMRPFGDVCMCGLSFVIKKEAGTILSLESIFTTKLFSYIHSHKI